MKTALQLRDLVFAAAPWNGTAKASLRLIAKGLALAAAAMATVLAIVVLVPDGNDYALATVKKHARLAASTSQKVVLVGGSNLAYGIDSRTIEHDTGCDVVNMGMNGYLGVRYMLEEVKPYLKPSDIVVVSLEYDSFYKSVDGTPSDQFMIVKANPGALDYLTAGQQLSLAGSLPYVAQQKLLRLIRSGGHAVAEAVLHKTPVRIDSIETLAGFNEYGDLTSHLGVKWQEGREDGMNLSALPMEAELIRLLGNFGDEMRSRGVGVIVSYTPVVREFYNRHKAAIENLHRILTQTPPLIVPRPPGGFVFDEPQFFDTVYHLNGEGRGPRTQNLVADLQRYLQSRYQQPVCRQTARRGS